MNNFLARLKKRKNLFFLTAILTIAAFLRLWQLNIFPPGICPEEAINGNYALGALETSHFKWFYQENNGRREGLFINIAAIWLKIFGNKIWALRLTSAIFGILTVLGIFLLTKELFKNIRSALFSSFFLTVSFWHLIFSRFASGAIMVPFFLTWSCWLIFLLINKTNKNPKKQKWWLIAGAAGFIFGLGFHSSTTYLTAPLILIIPFTKLWKNNQKTAIAIFILASFVFITPLGFHLLKHPANFSNKIFQTSIFSSTSPLKSLANNILKTIGMIFIKGDLNWRYNLSGRPELWWPLAIFFILGFTLSFKKIIKFGSFSESFLASWLIIMSLPVIISNESIPQAEKSIAIIPPIIIFSGLGLEAVFKKIQAWTEIQLNKFPEYSQQILRIRKKLILLLFIFLLLLASHTFIKYFLKWGPNVYTYNAFDGRYLKIGNYLNSLSPSDEKYVIVNGGEGSMKETAKSAQSVMFVTKTFSKKRQKEKKIIYLLPSQINQIKCKQHCFIITLKTDPFLRKRIKNQIKNLKLNISPGFEFLEK